MHPPKLNLDIFSLRNQSPEDSANLSNPGVFAARKSLL
jgi:hypothetical protein